MTRLRPTVFTTGTAIAAAGAALIGVAATAPPSPLSADRPVVHVQEVALTTSAVDPIPFEIGFLQALLEFEKLTGLGSLTVPQAVHDFGLGSLTPNELLGFTGLGNVTVGQLAQFADIFGLGQNPLSAVLAFAGASDATPLSQLAHDLPLGGQPLSDLFDITGISNSTTLSQAATDLGLTDQPLWGLYGLVGLNDHSTLQDTVNALGIGDTPVDTLLNDWGVGGDAIGGFLHQLGVTPQEVLSIFNTDPNDLPAGIWDPATGTFADGATVEEFANAIGLGHNTVDHLLTAGNLDDTTVNDLVNGIGLNYQTATIGDVLNKIEGFNSLPFGHFLSGFGLGSDSTVDDLFTALPGTDHTTIGDLFETLGLSDQSTIGQLLQSVPGITGITLNGLVGDLGVGDENLFDLPSSLLSSTTVEQNLTDILDALQAV